MISPEPKYIADICTLHRLNRRPYRLANQRALFNFKWKENKMPNKAEVLLTVVNTLPYRDLWMTADEFNSALQAGKSSHLAFSPKAMATVGDGVLKAYACVKVYHDNPLGSQSHISSTVSSDTNNSAFAYLYDELNIVAYGPRLYSLKPKADAIEQLVGLIAVHDGLQKAVAVCQILLSDYTEIPDDLVNHFISDGVSEASDNTSDDIESVKQFKRDIGSLALIPNRKVENDSNYESSYGFDKANNSNITSDRSEEHF